MLAIELRFPACRYHATAWSHHVNEGVVEWPPSSWRLLRALVATRHLKAAAEISEMQLATLVESLAMERPAYRLPYGTASHTRHYMPLYKDKTTKVFDTFIHIQRDQSLYVLWNELDLSESERNTLALLLHRMAYFGRAEAWIEARLAPPDAPPVEPNVRPLEDGIILGDDHELVRTLEPLAPAELARWRAQTFEQELARIESLKRQKQPPKGRDPSKIKASPTDKKKLDAALPKTVLEALHADTSELHKQGWSGVPGARWTDYARPRDLLTLAPSRRPNRTPSQLPTAARFAVASQVPPRLTDVVSLAARVRRALMSRSDAHPVFSGKAPDGNPLRGHPHAFILPEANGAHGRITHVALYAPMGFDERARRAMDGLNKVWGRDQHDVQLVLLGVGQPQDFAGTNRDAGQCPLFVESDTWMSRTPFVPTRHPKTKRGGVPKTDENGLQIGSAEHDLRRLLTEAGFPNPVRVERVAATELGGKQTPWLAFKTERFDGTGRRAAKSGTGFRVVFPEPVRGPIAVGYGAHFGLGMLEHERAER